MPEVKKAVAVYLASLNLTLAKIPTPIRVACRNCEYRASDSDARDGFRECWGKLADIKPHLLDLYHVSDIGGRGGPIANGLIHEGKVSLFDMPKARLVKAKGEVGERNKRQIIQIDYTKKDVEWMSPELPDILRALRYPLHFIDFETAAIAVPYHAGMHPYEPVAFQWSCHRLEAPDGPLTHSEWINVEDVFPNFKFAESQMECVGNEGTVFMWATHENTILRDILRQMGEREYRNPKLVQWLKTMVRSSNNPGRLVDLNRITVGHYFHPLMKGRTSIKKVSDALWQTNPSLRKAFPEYVKEQDGMLLSPYDSLPPLKVGGELVAVAEGTGAVRAYEAMVYGVEKDDPETKQKWKRLLLQYCKLDTLSMVMVWRHWGEKAEGRMQKEESQ